MINEWKEKLKSQIDFLRGDFILASGKKSDFYFNGKTSTLRAEGLNLTSKILLSMIEGKGINRVGGMTLGADAMIGAVVAMSFDAKTPYEGFIVRKEPKGHGTGQWIEGPELKAGDKIAILEDVVTTGGSSIQAIDRVLETCPDVEIVGVFALVDRLDGGREALAEKGYKLYSIFTKDDLL